MPLLYDDPGMTSYSYRRGGVGRGYDPAGTVTPGKGRLAPYAGYSLRATRSLFSGRGRRPQDPRTTGRPSPPGVSRFARRIVGTASNPKRLRDYSFRDIAPTHTTLGRMRATFPRYGTWT